MIGQTVSHYKIIEKLGQGGMGVVYKAQDITLDRFVALKFLPPHLAQSEADKARFMQEAKAASAISHPNVCTIYSVEEFEGQLFIAMEFVEGQTLRARKDSITFKQGIEIGIQIAEGLAAAHEKGIVHRDIKPENIMLRKDGMVQIMDFGLAKLRASGSKITRLTKEGSTVGTAGYMSPEQVQGLETDHRSDIFSYGVVLYELLTGELPFRGVHETAVAYEIVNVDPAPMSAIKPEIEGTLDVIVLECLEKEPRERRQSIAQTALDLKRYKRESTRSRASRITAARPAIKVDRTTGAMEAGTTRGGLFQYAGYGLAAVLAVVVVFLLWVPSKHEFAMTSPVVRTSINLADDAQVSPLSQGMTISPDGKSLVYTSVSGQLYVRRLDLGTTKPIQGAFGYQPEFSQDGESIVYMSISSPSVSKVSLTGAPPEVLYTTQSIPQGFWWTRDNSILFGGYSGPIYKLPAKGGTPVAITKLDSAAGEISHRGPQLLPDGKTIIYYVKVREMASFDDALIVAEKLGGERKVIIKGGYGARYLANGYIVYMRGKSLFAVRFDPASLETSGSPILVEDGGILNSDGNPCFGVSANGVLAYSPASSYKNNSSWLMTWLDRNGTTHPLSDTLRNFYLATFSPDGRKLAASIISANNDIWVYDIPRGIFSRVSLGWGNNDNPVWSPDGKYIYYAAEKGRTANIFRRTADGSTPEERILMSDNLQAPSSFSPDGKSLAYTEGGDIWILPYENGTNGPAGKPYQFIHSPAAEYSGVFSRDGKWLCYFSDESGTAELYVTSFPKHEGKWQISNGGGVQAFFSRDGKRLYFYDNASNLFEVDIRTGATFDYSNPRKLLQLPQNNGASFLADISPDGKQFLILANTVTRDSIKRLDVVTNWFEVINNKIAESKN